MNGDVEGEAPRPRPLSAGIWTLFSWLRRSERSSSSESVSSVGSDRTVASFDFLAPLNYKNVNTPLVLPSDPLTETYKKRLHERNLRRQYDRDLTLRRKYGLYREEGLGYDAFSLPSARRLQKDTVLRQDRERRATSESTRRSAYVPGKRRAPLPPIGVVSATLPRTYKRKRPAPKPPVKLSEGNKENVEINNIIQMNSTADVDKHSCLSKDITLENKTGKHSKHETKDIKLRTDKSFLKHIFDSKKRNSAIDTSRIKLLPSISELDKQAAEIIEANKALRASGHNDSSGSSSTSAEETWICTTCLRKYKPVVTCCIYCVIKENSNIKNSKKIPTYASSTSSQTDENSLNSSRKSGNDDKKKLREMLKEMKDSLPKRPKHNDKYPGEDRDCIIKTTETPTLRIGSTIDENIRVRFNNTDNHEKKHEPEHNQKNTKETFLTSQPSSSKDSSLKFVTSNELNRKSALESLLPNLNNSGSGSSLGKKLPSKVLGKPVKDSLIIVDKSKIISNKDNKVVNKSENHIKEIKEKSIQNGLPTLINSTSSEKEAEFTKSNENINVSKIFARDSNQTSILQIKKYGHANSDTKNKIETMQLGNVLSSNVANIDQTEGGNNSMTNRNINLHTPLKISSLLNPLYTPKYKTSNDKITDCNIAKILTTKVTNLDSHKKEDNQQTILPSNTVSTTIIDINVQAPNKSHTKLFHEALQKSEASCSSSSKTSEAKKIENTSSINYEPERKVCETILPNNTEPIIDINVQAPSTTHKKLFNEALQKSEASSETSEAKKCENASSEVKALPSPSVKNVDLYDMRRHLINQLEQAISKGDEQLAAEAAAKLAKLKLACSVLSFSSQIVSEQISNKTEILRDNITSEENKTKNHIDPNSASNVRVDANEMPDKALKEKVEQDDQKNTSSKYNEIKIPEASASTSSQFSDDEVPIEIWVEDKEAARGPIPLRISRKARMGELKQHVETSLGLDIRLQRWIVGRTLCTNDNTPLGALAGPNLNAPFYLCLVESETNKDNSPPIKANTHTQIKTEANQINNTASGDVYTELMKLEQQALVPNAEEFECGVCIAQCVAGAGVVLRECIHTFCRDCLTDVIRHCEEPVVPCPAIQCPGALQEREIRAILSAEEYERWLARGLAAAESGTRNTFHCRTRDCKGWAFCEPGVRRFPCPVCKHTNCVSCQAVHEGDTCEQYQVKLRETVSAAESNQTDEGTQALLKSLISRGEALECPECSAIITKKWGCDWVKCSACKTEICWVTKGRRWGPGGKGDTSGGCRCGVEGKRCHPSCGYCH